MPIHDWTRVPSGLYHDFHQVWTIAVRNALNTGLLPKGYFALTDQRTGGPEPDVIAVETSRRGKPSRSGGAARAEPPPTRVVDRLEPEAVRYARKANRISVQHPLGEVVAVIEIVSPGNKDSRNSFRSFVEKSAGFLRSGVHLLVVDLFPPTARDPQGVHKAIWDEFQDRPYNPPEDKPLTLAGYSAAEPMTAYVEPVAVGDRMPDMPLFVTADEWVPVPLEQTYQATWGVYPEPIREMLERPAPAPETPS